MHDVSENQVTTHVNLAMDVLWFTEEPLGDLPFWMTTVCGAYCGVAKSKDYDCSCGRVSTNPVAITDKATGGVAYDLCRVINLYGTNQEGFTHWVSAALEFSPQMLYLVVRISPVQNGQGFRFVETQARAEDIKILGCVPSNPWFLSLERWMVKIQHVISERTEERRALINCRLCNV